VIIAISVTEVRAFIGNIPLDYGCAAARPGAQSDVLASGCSGEHRDDNTDFRQAAKASSYLPIRHRETERAAKSTDAHFAPS
jgi:hypothetical protein